MLPFPTPVADRPLRIALHEGSRRELWPLFKLSDDSLVAIGESPRPGRRTRRDDLGMTVGHSQVVEVEPGVCELRVDRDAYGPHLGYSDELSANGIRVRDRVWLELDL